MYEGRRVAVVVPAHNEETLIARTITTMPDLVDHVIVIDDASTDSTAEKAWAAGDPRVEVVTLERNQGVGGAVLTGHRRAVELDVDISVVMAGDAQMDPDYLPDILHKICTEGYDFAKANRFFSFLSFKGMPRTRILGNVFVSFLAKAATGYWNLFDPLNGYTALTTDMIRRLPLDDIRRDYSFECDLMIRLNILRARATDVAVPAVYGDEVSGIRLPRASFALLWTFFVGFWRRMLWKYVLWSFSPVAMFLGLGLALTAWGVGFGIWVVVETIGPPVASTGTVLLSVAPLLLGAQFLIMAWVLDVLDNNGR